MDAADEAYFPAPDIGERPEGEWHQDDTLFVPLYDREGKLAAVLDLYDPADRRLPSLELIKPLEVFATHAAVAIENARYYEELQSASAALEEQLACATSCWTSARCSSRRSTSAPCSSRRAPAQADRRLRRHRHPAGRRGAPASWWPSTPATPTPTRCSHFRISLDEGLAGWVVRHNQAQLVNDMGSDPRGVLVPGHRSTSRRPPSSCRCRCAARSSACSAIDRLGGRTFEERELEPARLFANLAAIAIQNARTYEEMEVQAISDGLTGIHNYRHFQETLKASVSRAGRYGETFCLLMMDLDHFKAVNDTVGHQQGDEVLRAVAGVLRRCSRESDYLARYGGEEFVMILPQTSLDEARNMAERIRASGAPASTPASPDLHGEHVDRRGLVPGVGRRQRRRAGRRRRGAAARQGARPRPRVPVHRGAAGSHDARRRPRRPGPPLRAAHRPVRGGDRRASSPPSPSARSRGAVQRRGAGRPRARPGRDGGRRGGSRRRQPTCAPAPTTRSSTAASTGTAAATRTACAASASRAWRAPSPSAASTARSATRRRTATASPSCAPRRRASSTHAWCSASRPSWDEAEQLRRPPGQPTAARRSRPHATAAAAGEQLMVAAGRGVPY